MKNSTAFNKEDGSRTLYVRNAQEAFFITYSNEAPHPFDLDPVVGKINQCASTEQSVQVAINFAKGADWDEDQCFEREIYEEIILKYGRNYDIKDRDKVLGKVEDFAEFLIETDAEFNGGLTERTRDVLTGLELDEEAMIERMEIENEFYRTVTLGHHNEAGL